MEGPVEATREGSSGRDRILIVEDNVVAVMVLRKKFCESGFADDAIDTVTSGEEAVDQARKNLGRLQFIMMDVCLAGTLDGFEATRAIRAFDGSTPIVIASGVHSPDWQGRARTAGAQGLLTKPVTTDMVQRMLRDVEVRPWAHMRRISDPCELANLDFFALQATAEEERQGNALLAAVRAGDVAAVRATLEAAPELIDWCDPTSKNSALHFAARTGSEEVVAALLAAGGDVTRCSLKGYSALHVAAWSGFLGCVKLLLDAGSSVSLKSGIGMSPFDVSAPEISAYLIEHNYCKEPVRSPGFGNKVRQQRERSISGPGSPGRRLRATAPSPPNGAE